MRVLHAIAGHPYAHGMPHTPQPCKQVVINSQNVYNVTDAALTSGTPLSVGGSVGVEVAQGKGVSMVRRPRLVMNRKCTRFEFGHARARLLTL